VAPAGAEGAGPSMSKCRPNKVRLAPVMTVLDRLFRGGGGGTGWAPGDAAIAAARPQLDVSPPPQAGSGSSGAAGGQRAYDSGGALRADPVRPGGGRGGSRNFLDHFLRRVRFRFRLLGVVAGLDKRNAAAAGVDEGAIIAPSLTCTSRVPPVRSFSSVSGAGASMHVSAPPPPSWVSAFTSVFATGERAPEARGI
jgi:hypothetical protein